MKYTRICAALAAAMLSLASCSGPLRTLKPEGEYLCDASRAINYYNAPVCYEPEAVGDPYASFTSGSTEVTLYAIPGLDPELWLTEDYTGIGSLFVSSEITLPPLEEFGADTIHLCVQSKTVWEFATVTDRALVDEVIRTFTEGESVPYPSTTPSVDLRLKFSSPDYPSIYYNLIYVDYGDARYLYDRSTRRCVEIGDLLSAYIDGAISPAESESGSAM